MVQPQGPIGGGAPEKGLFEKLFPSVYALWRMLRKPRPATATATKDRPRPASPQQRRGRPISRRGAEPESLESPTDQADQASSESLQDAPVQPPYEVETAPEEVDTLPAQALTLEQEPPPASQIAETEQSPLVQPSVGGVPDLRLESNEEQAQRFDELRETPLRLTDVREAEGPLQAAYRSELLTVTPGAQVQNDLGTPPLSLEMADEYDADRVGMERTIDEASEELRGVQSIRSEAAGIRLRSHQVLDTAEVVQEETERVMAKAGNAFAKAVALNPETLSSLAATVRTLEEAIRIERHLRRQTRDDAEEEADRARQRATDAILSSLAGC